MKIEHIKPADEPVPEIVSIITFDPWPFRDDRVIVPLACLISYRGRLRSPSGWYLSKYQWNRLAVLSDGTVAVVESGYQIGTRLYRK